MGQFRAQVVEGDRQRPLPRLLTTPSRARHDLVERRHVDVMLQYRSDPTPFWARTCDVDGKIANIHEPDGALTGRPRPLPAGRPCVALYYERRMATQKCAAF
jgi:hypothetical protein